MYRICLNGFVLGLGVAMDATAISITNGLNYSYLNKKKYIIIALCFGFFQAFMPVIGYFLGIYTLNKLLKYLPIISFVILCFLGFKIIIDNFFPSKNDILKEKQISAKLVFSQAIATSIDALSIGVTLINLTFFQLFITILHIFLITFIFSFLGSLLGKKFGLKYKNIAEILGGCILVLLGVLSLF